MLLKRNTHRHTRSQSPEHWMELALKEAARGASRGEIPVGAVVVLHGKLISKAHNRSEEKNNFLEHAEHIALEQAARKLGRWRLQEAELFVTLEPCAMCAGTILLSRIAKVYYGARDPKAGADGSALQVLRDKKISHRVQVVEGLLAAECGKILTDFFKRMREQRKKGKRVCK